MRRFELALPSTVEECLAAISNGGGEVKMVAGDTDLLPQMKNGLVKPARVVDLSGIQELKRLEVTADGALHIGSAVSASVALISSIIAIMRRSFSIMLSTISTGAL